MLFSWKKKTDVPDLAWLHTDMHSHLLPGIDDGSPDLATSMKLIKGMVELGYKKLVTTPHILWEMYPNDPQIINTKTEEVRQELGVQGIDVDFQSAAEYFIDDHFASQLEVRAPLFFSSMRKALNTSPSSWGSGMSPFPAWAGPSARPQITWPTVN